MRSPVCGCGFQPGDRAEIAIPENPEEKINRYLESYIEILHNPKVLESLAVRSYALQDVDPGIAGRLKELADAFKALDTFDEVSTEEATRQLAVELDIGGGKLIHPTRLAVTGMTTGPGLFELLALLGRDTVVKRMRKAELYIRKECDKAE